MSLRLDRYLTTVGAGTRSEVKKMIRSKQVTVNGVTADRPEAKVDEDRDEVCLCGQKLDYNAYEYYILHKPAGCVSATKDSLHKTVMDFLTGAVQNDLFPVGRLDMDTEGLLLITNDGALAHDLLSPSKHVEKTYYAKIDGVVTEDDVILFEKGVDIGEKTPLKPAKLVILESGAVSEIELTITEGKFHQVKRMFLAAGKPVIYLKRLSMGPLTLPEDLEPGEYRALTEEELQSLGVSGKTDGPREK